MTIAAKHNSYTVPYGVINTSGVELEKIEEQPTYNFLVSAGIYVINASMLNFGNIKFSEMVWDDILKQIDINIKASFLIMKNY